MAFQVSRDRGRRPGPLGGGGVATEPHTQQELDKVNGG